AMSTLKTDRGNAENGDTRAQRSQRSSFLREEHLDFAKDDIVQLREPVRFHIHLFFQSNRFSAQDSVKNGCPNGAALRVEGVFGLRNWSTLLSVSFTPT